MRRFLPAIVAVSAVVTGAGAAVPVRSAGSWGRAIRVPGLAALGRGNAKVYSVSCGSAGNCAAGGDYQDHVGSLQGFVAAERDGRWGTAFEVPGLRALNTGLIAFVSSVSCAPAGSCAAGGSYQDRRGEQGFVAVDRDGRWGKAIAVPGLAALNKGDAVVFSVSCAPAGTCAAGGEYFDRTENYQGFVVSQATAGRGAE